MDTALTLILAILSYLLGSCPFSVWVGKLALGKDIRGYGDGNPGAANVFRTGSRFWGIVALLADVVKGMPFILIARLVFGLPQATIYIIAVCAVLGHGYSPFLGFRGGKALAVFGGTLLAIPQWDMVISFAIFLFIGFLFIESDSWTVILAAAGSLTYLILSRADMLETLFIASVLVVFAIKHLRSLRMVPHHSGRLINWIRSRKRLA